MAIGTTATANGPGLDGETAGVAAGMSYGKLSQKHAEYDLALFTKLEDLYVGGFHIQKRARLYLPKLVNEHDKRHAERCAITSYQPFFGQIVEQFGSDVFGQQLSVKPAADAKDPKTPGVYPDEDFYTAFEKDVDLEGTSFVDLMHECLVQGLKKRYALVAIDAPADNSPEPPISKADEEARGTNRCYAYEVPVEQLIDWKMTPKGSEFVWAILNKVEQDRLSPEDTRDQIVETFTVWTMDGDRARWRRYVAVYDDKKAPEDQDIVPLKDEGLTSFDKIPLLRFEVPVGLWVGNKIGPQALEHYQRRSALLSAENRSMVAIPTLKKGSEAPAVGGPIPAEITQNPSRGNNPVGHMNNEGWVELGAEDSLEFAEPKGHCYELVDKQLDSLKEAMFAVNHQMAASIRPTGAALGRSGLSKQKDQDATERVLRALGHLVREFAVRVFIRVSQARGEKETHWTAHGLDDYGSIDREQLLEEAISVDQVAIPSVTFRKLHKRVVAEQLLKGKVDPSTMTTIVQEIEDGVNEEEDLRTLMKDAKVDAIKNPPPPVVAPVGGQAVKAPTVPAVKTPQAVAKDDKQ
jgi:hypothetical protein